MTKEQKEMHEAKIVINVSTLLYTARKIRAKTQQEIADLVGISQSNYSKMERGILMPSAKEWAIFCMGMNIPVSSMIKGYIDEGEVFGAKQDLGLLKFPSQYLEKTSLQVRYLRPLLNFGESVYGVEAFNERLKNDCRVEPGFFIKLDHQTNHKLMIDLANYLLDDTNKNIKDIFTEDFQTESVHGELHAIFTACKTPLQAVQEYIKHADRYDCYYQRNLVSKQEDRIEIDHTLIQGGHKLHRSIIDEFNMHFVKGIAQYPAKDAKIRAKTQVISGETTRLIIECA